MANLELFDNPIKEFGPFSVQPEVTISNIALIEDPNARHYNVLTDNIPEVKKLLDKLIAVARKKGFPLMRYSVSAGSSIPDPHDESGLMSIGITTITIHFPVLHLGEYSLLAKIDHASSDIPLVSRAENFEKIPKRFLEPNCPPNCDHCNINRNRNNTWLLQHKDTGDVKQIGTSCITEYTSTDSADAMLDYFTLTMGDVNTILFSYGQYEDEMGSARYSMSAEPKVVLATALAVMHRTQSGYISTSKSHENAIMSTGQLVSNSLFGMKKLISKLEIEPFLCEAEAALKWESEIGLPEKFKNTEFGHNLHALVRSGSVVEKKCGVVVALIPFYHSYLADQKRAEFISRSTKQGEPGEKITRKLTLFNKFEVSSQFGLSTVKLFNDDAGNTYKYKSNSHDALVLKDYEYDAKMTVKDHQEYKGVLQTVVTRVTFPAIDAFRKFIESTDIKACLKLLSVIPADLHIKTPNGSSSHWMKFAVENNLQSLNAKKLIAYMAAEKHSDYLETLFERLEDFIDYLPILEGEKDDKFMLFKMARTHGAKFAIERDGVTNPEINQYLRFYGDTKSALVQKQFYLDTLSYCYDNVPTLSDDLLNAINEFPVAEESRLLIDDTGALIFAAISDHTGANFITQPNAVIEIKTVEFDLSSDHVTRLLNESFRTKLNQISRSELLDLALRIHNADSKESEVGDHSELSGMDRIHAGSESGMGSGLS